MTKACGVNKTVGVGSDNFRGGKRATRARLAIAFALPLAIFVAACGEVPDGSADEVVTEADALGSQHIMVRTPRTPRSFPSVLVTTWLSNTPHPKCVRVNPGSWSGTGISVPAHTWVDFSAYTDSNCQSRPCCYINGGGYSPGAGLSNWWVDLK